MNLTPAGKAIQSAQKYLPANANAVINNTVDAGLSFLEGPSGFAKGLQSLSDVFKSVSKQKPPPGLQLQQSTTWPNQGQVKPVVQGGARKSKPRKMRTRK